MAKGRGRPAVSPEEKVMPNGLFPRQWDKLKELARKKGYGESGGAAYLRFIVDAHLAEESKKIKTVAILQGET